MALRLALYQPDIPQNAGTMLRLCACLGVTAVIVEPASFPTSDRAFRRAGMDYLDRVAIERHISFAAFEAWRVASGHRLVLLTTSAAGHPYDGHTFEESDILMVGRESAGVPQAVHASADIRLTIPMAEGLRSLNVAVAAAMVLGEALRQTRQFPPSRASSEVGTREENAMKQGAGAFSQPGETRKCPSVEDRS